MSLPSPTKPSLLQLPRPSQMNLNGLLIGANNKERMRQGENPIEANSKDIKSLTAAGSLSPSDRNSLAPL